MIKKNYSYKLSSVTKEQILPFVTEDLSMGGWQKTSTLDATIEVPPSPYLRLKMGTASEATPLLSGIHLGMQRKKMLLLCYLTSLSKGTSQTHS
jgi:hypothetical protein